MNHLEDILKARRDTRHFTDQEVPDEVLQKALQAGHWAPSVGLTDATKYFVVRSQVIKRAVKELFLEYSEKAESLTDNEAQKAQYKALKLEAIEEAPIGLIIAYDRSVLNQFTIGTVGSNEAVKFSAVCAAQNIWLSLTDQGFGMGWVSIINYYQFKKILDLPDHIEPLGYFCIGKPATNYDNQPMLQQLQWRKKSEHPVCTEIKKLSDYSVPSKAKQEQLLIKDQTELKKALQKKIDDKSKPVGSLGVVESLALQMGLVFQTISPKIIKPTMLVFAADHGIANYGVSAYPQDVTRQMVINFLEGGAAINVFCEQHGIELSIVDAGVNYDFPTDAKLINAKIAKGTQSFLHGPAMTARESALCFEKGKQIVEDAALTGCNCIGFGEMGIGNTSTASVLMSLLTNFPVLDCVGMGTGVINDKLTRKQTIISDSIANYNGSREITALLSHFGGFEILQMASAMLTAYEKRMLIMVDGFICSVAFLIATKINPLVKDNAVFCHQSAEQAHKKLIDYLGVKPILQLDLRLGEGTGCALAFPIIKSAELFLNNMSSFESAGVDRQ